MRSIRTMMLLACAVAVAVAFAAPAGASASNWTKEGKELGGPVWSQEGAPLGGTGGSLTLEGRLRFGGALGSVDCPMSAAVTLDPNSGSGHLTSFTSSAAGCTVGGTLKTVCGSVTSVTANSLPWSVSATGSGADFTISGASITYKFTEKKCEPGVTYTGNLIATPSNPKAIGSVSWSGTVKDSSGTNATASGTVNASPAGKYGISGGIVEVAGTLGWEGPNGAMKCPASGVMALESGSSKGKLTSLNWDAANCTLSGPIKAACGEKSVTYMQSTALPWALTDQGTSIKISGVSFMLNYKETSACHVGGGNNEDWSGELIAGPNKTSAISSTSLSGSLLKDGTVLASWSGSLNWTPAGVFGL